MNITILLIVGAIFGFLAGYIVGTDEVVDSIKMQGYYVTSYKGNSVRVVGHVETEKDDSNDDKWRSE